MGRKWSFVTAGIAVLSLGTDAAAQKHAHVPPGLQKSGWAGPDSRGPHGGLPPGLIGTSPGHPSLGRGDPNERPSNRGLPHKSNKSAAHDSAPGKDTESATPKEKQLHEMPTCR